MSKKPRSIRNVVLALFAFSTIAAFSLFTAYDAVISGYYRGESSAITRIFRPAPSAGNGVRTLTQVLRKLNAAMLHGPEALSDRGFLEELSAQASPFCIALRQGDAISYRSPKLDGMEHFALPDFGAPAEDRPFPEAEQNPRVLFQLDFISAAGLSSSIFVLTAPRDKSAKAPFSKQMLLLAALLLLSADSAAGVFFIIRLTKPLRRVEAAALAMSSGDLDTPVEGDQILELSRVFDALEKMRSEIRELLRRQRNREAERRELIANLSHDLRTPLAAIRGYIDGLREGIADTPTKRERYLEVLGQKIQDLDRMIGQIFLLSTLEAQASPPELRRVDLRAFIADSIEELSLAHGPEEASIAATGLDGTSSDASLFVLADPLQLRRVIENFVDNSLRHSGRRPVSIRLSLTRLDSSSGRRARLRVEDNGRGIPSADLERSFERFFRGDPARSSAGFGLGLAIAKQIVEAHGGSVRAEASGAGGLAIVVELPLNELDA